jgi:DNA-binding MarR family transcriptional regulator
VRIREFISKSYIFAIAHGYDVVWRKFNGRLKARGCNINEALVLIALFFEEDKQANPSAIAATLRTSRGNVSHCLANLERQKYVRRALSERDARRLSVHLTAAGTKLAQTLIGDIEGIEDYCESHFRREGLEMVLGHLFAMSGDRP